MKDYFGYSGKICVVTGAGSGIGRATATLLAEMGADVYALDFRDPKLDGIKKWVPTNLLDKDQIDATFAQLPDEIDCYFGIAGVSGSQYPFLHTVTVDFIANRYITQTYLDKRIRNGGRIAYVSSQVCRNWHTEEIKEEFMPLIEAEGWDGMIAAAEKMAQNVPGSFAYILAKRAISYFAASNVLYFGERDIRVNCIIPTSTNTNMMAEGIQTMGNDTMYRICIPANKAYADASVMAKALVYLNSDFAEYISGLDMYVDWGLEAAMRVGQIGDPMGMGISIKTMLGG